MSAGLLRRTRARLATVPAPLVALVLLFVLSLALVIVQASRGDGDGDGDGGDGRGAAGQPAPAVPGPASGPGGEPAGDTDAPLGSAAVGALPEPERLRVPAMDLDERLVDLAIAPDGTMEVPEDPDRVGWFTGGGRPGGPGPTVVAGHVDSLEGPAVFARLGEVAVGDEVLLDTAAGTATYVVSDVRAVPRDDFPTAEVFGATRSDVVRLVTCHGRYDRGGAGYTENLVVTAQRA